MITSALRSVEMHRGAATSTGYGCQNNSWVGHDWITRITGSKLHNVIWHRMRAIVAATKPSLNPLGGTSSEPSTRLA